MNVMFFGKGIFVDIIKLRVCNEAILDFQGWPKSSDKCPYKR